MLHDWGVKEPELVLAFSSPGELCFHDADAVWEPQQEVWLA